MSADVGLLTVSDPRVLAWAIRQGLPVLTRDSEDFKDLHHLVMTAGGHHPGMLIVRFDADPRHNMSHRQIGVAITKLESASVPVADQVHVLNHWRVDGAAGLLCDRALFQPDCLLTCPACGEVLVCHWCKTPYDGGVEESNA